MARVVYTDVITENISAVDSEWVYNGLDCCVTLEVMHKLDEEENFDNQAKATYAFSQNLQAPILEMAIRGIRVNLERQSIVLSQYEQMINKLERNLTRIVKDGVGFAPISTAKTRWWRSPDQLKSLLYEHMGLPPVRKRNAQGRMAPTVNREAIEKLSLYFLAEPICSHILTMRDLEKKRQFLSTALDPDGRIRTSFNIAGTNTGRLASSMSDFGTGCVRPSAQALTPEGWRPLSDLQDGDYIAQYNKGIIEFVPAQFHWTDFAGELMFYNTEQVALAVTPDHRVLSRDYQGRATTLSARDTFNKYAQRQIPIAGKFTSGTKTVPVYLAMLMADCSKEGTVWRGGWKKDKKITRALQLLDAAGINYNLRSDSRSYARLTIYADITLPKKYGPWVLDLTYDSAKALVDEAKFWDAHIRGTSFIFYTADREEAEWFQTLCHLVGYGTTLRWARNSKEAYGNQSIIYSVNVKPRDHAQVLRKHWSPVQYTGKVGCPQVPSTYWLVRENGHISVTGNTNLQNVDRTLRSVFMSDPGMKFANIDLEQGDSRNLGALCWERFVEKHGEKFAGAYLDACESGDLHTTVSRMSRPHLPWTDDPVANRKLADTKYYRNDSYRDLDKKLGHGSNYLGSPRTMSKHAKVPVKEVETFQRNYFGAFPCIPAYHDYVKEELATTHQLTTLWGRRRFFFGRPNDDATLREAVAYCPQSMTADVINLGMLNVWRGHRVQLLLQVHDSILFQYPEELEDEIIPWAIKCLRVSLDLARGRQFIIPAEAKIGWNWGDFSKTNPDGMIKWKGGDDRKRTEHYKLFT